MGISGLIIKISALVMGISALVIKFLIYTEHPEMLLILFRSKFGGRKITGHHNQLT